jgi:hypothetical protein
MAARLISRSNVELIARLQPDKATGFAVPLLGPPIVSGTYMDRIEAMRGCCQSNANRSPHAGYRSLSGTA